jgi:hypothetical protein
VAGVRSLLLSLIVAALGCSASGGVGDEPDGVGNGGTTAGSGGGGGEGAHEPDTGGTPGVGGETPGTGAVPGAGGGTAPWVCGDGYCDPVYEGCYWCPADCGGPCPGSGGAGAGGAPPAGGGGSSSTLPPAIEDAMNRAESGVGFSYWWGHGAFLPQGPDSSSAGSCSGGCPSCTHTGKYGGDCSGYVAKVWQVPASNSDLANVSHPYSTIDFNKDSSQWSTIDQGSMKTGDAMVYNNGSAGHIFIFDHGDPWGSLYAYECKGCSYGCTAGIRSATTAYHAIRKTGF